MDYAYLARAEAKMILASDAAVDAAKLSKMNNLIRMATAKETPLEEEFGEVGKKLYRAREYGLASTVFDALISGSKSSLIDQLYFANSVFYNAAQMDTTARVNYQGEMLRADSVYALVIEGSPTTQDTYFNRARINRYITNAEANTVKHFEEYIKVLEEKGEAEIAKASNKSKLVEAYASIGFFYIESEPDNDKALSYINKALEYDPTDEYALQLLDFLKSKK